MGGGLRGLVLRVGRERVSMSWQKMNEVDRIITGFLIGIGRFGHIAIKYENITRSPPT